MFETDWIANSIQGLNIWLAFEDSTFENQLSRDHFENAICKKADRYSSSGQPENRCKFSAHYNTTISVRNQSNQIVPDATVAISDLANKLVFQGQSDENGKATALLDHFETIGATKKLFTDHTISASKDAATGNATAYADRVQNVPVVIINP